MGVFASVGIVIVQGVAIAHGLLTLALAVLYSLTRRDTWTRNADEELLFKKGRCLSLG